MTLIAATRAEGGHIFDRFVFSMKATSCLFDKISLEKNKNICLAGDFNVNLINVSSHLPSSEFMNILSSNYFLPTITLPTKLNASGNDTLIDNIFSNIFNPDIISGNILFNASDGHLPSFAIFPRSNQNHLPKKHTVKAGESKRAGESECLLF